MQQLRFTLENDEETLPSLPMPTERELKLIERMAQAILALLQQLPGEEDERT
jgi:hypothetical protein